MNHVDSQSARNNNNGLRSVVLIILFYVSTCGVASAASEEFEKHPGKESVFFQKEGLTLSRHEGYPEKVFCNSPNKYYIVIVVYDTSHLQRLKVMASTYEEFVAETVIPAIVKMCGDRVNANNMNILLNMFRKGNVTWQDALFFTSRKNGVTYKNYRPGDAKNNLTAEQIAALKPASQIKAEKEYFAKLQSEADAAIKRSHDRKKYGWRCRYGCVTLCNESATTYTIATSHLRWRDEGVGREVEVEGWFKLKPNHCYPPQVKIYWWTYYSVAVISKNGKWTFPRWPVKKALMNGRKKSGMSGVRGFSMCVKKTDKFMRRVPGKFNAIFNKSCPKGYVKVPVNLFTQGREGSDLVNLLGSGGTSPNNRVRSILLPQKP